MKLKLELEGVCNQFDLENEYDLFNIQDVKALQADIEFILNFLRKDLKNSQENMEPKGI